MSSVWLEPNMIASVGFPIAVATYLLLRNEKTLKGLTQAITDLRISIIEKQK